MRHVTSEMEQHEAQPVPVVVKAAEAATKASTEAWAAATSNAVPPTTADRSAELQGSEPRDEMPLRAQTTVLADPNAARDAIDLAPAPDEHPESHPSAGCSAAEDASPVPKTLASHLRPSCLSVSIHRN